MHLNSVIQSMSSVDFSLMYLLISIHTLEHTLSGRIDRENARGCGRVMVERIETVLDADGSSKVLRSRFKFCRKIY